MIQPQFHNPVKKSRCLFQTELFALSFRRVPRIAGNPSVVDTIDKDPIDKVTP